MSILVLGDSHLARVSRELVALLPDATVRAFGGAVATDLPAQCRGLDLAAYDVVLVSLGTNDAGWREVPLDVFTDALGALLDQVAGSRVVLVTSPGADEARAPDWSNAKLSTFAAAASALVSAAGGTVIDTPALLAPLGTEAFLDDGFHLTPAAYGLLLPAIARAAASA
jgi:lysophospholipase L1-like esterase